MKGCWIWAAGEWGESSGVPPGDRGFRFGLHVFETVRVNASGRTPMWDRHRASLARAAAAMDWGGFEPGERLAPPRLEEAGVLRVYWTAGDGSAQGEISRGRLIATFQPGQPAPLPEAGWRTGEGHEALPRRWAGWKSGSYGVRLGLIRAIRAAGWDEGVLVFPEGEISGWCFGNLLLRRAGCWQTPADADIRKGVALDWLRERHPVERLPLTRALLREADALVFCNAVRGFVPVASHLGRRLARPPVVQEWAEAWEAAMQG